MGSQVLCSILASMFACAVLSAQSIIITTVAGVNPADEQPLRGYSGDGGPATSALLSLANLQNSCDPVQYEQATHIAFDAAGNLYIADSENQRIRRVSPSGIITTVAGSGDKPSVNARCEPVSSVVDGPAAFARLFNPADILPLPSGSLVIADQQNNRLRQLTVSGSVTTLAGSGVHNLYAPGIPATSSPMDWPSAIASDANGLVYFAELHGNRIGRIEPNGNLSTIAGLGLPGFTGDNGPAASATLRKPTAITFDSKGALYIADTANHRIRKVSNGVITTVAGNGQAAFCGDGGPAQQACLNTPMDVRTDITGNLYIADTLNHRVRRVDPSGIISTIAGTGVPGFSPDGTSASAAQLNYPAALALDARQDVYIADWQNYLIRKLTSSKPPEIAPSGVVNAASFTEPVAPGALFSAFGTNLSARTETAAVAPWPVNLAGVSVEFNGIPVPLYLVSPSQINGQVPFEMNTGTTSVVVRTPSGASVPAALTVAAAAPQMFLYSGAARAVAANQDGTLNTSANPETRGRVLVFYLTGQGAVAPSAGTGQPAPSGTLSRATLPASATIGGVTAQVQFLGLAPGLIGVGQANLSIPDAAPPGPDVPVVIEIAGQSSETAFVAIR